jgi:hypothetical protein
MTGVELLLWFVICFIGGCFFSFAYFYFDSQKIDGELFEKIVQALSTHSCILDQFIEDKNKVKEVKK